MKAVFEDLRVDFCRFGLSSKRFLEANERTGMEPQSEPSQVLLSNGVNK
jgi:hypothetical protein